VGKMVVRYFSFFISIYSEHQGSNTKNSGKDGSTLF
jgi:hypothetical protein